MKEMDLVEQQTIDVDDGKTETVDSETKPGKNQAVAFDKMSQYRLICNEVDAYAEVISEYNSVSPPVWYTIDDLNQNGRLELIVAIYNGLTAMYVDFAIFEVNESKDELQQYQFSDTNTYMKDIETGESIFYSSPDIITDTVKWMKNSTENRYEYYWVDTFRSSPGECYNGYYKIWFEEYFVCQELQAYCFRQGSEEDAVIIYYDEKGNEITEEQFDALISWDTETNEKVLKWLKYEDGIRLEDWTSPEETTILQYNENATEITDED